jgi:predicted PurR-regulated permease PerM
MKAILILLIFLLLFLLFLFYEEAWQLVTQVWQKIEKWFKDTWNNYIWPKLEWLGEKISSFFKKKTEESKAAVEEKIGREKESLWQRIKNLIK